MNRLATIVRAAATALAFAATAALAGGPLVVCNQQGVKYPGAGTVTLNYDGGGMLGSRTKAQADAIVTNAVSLWTNVSTSTVSLVRGADLPVDVTVANYAPYLNNFSDGLNPIIYDTDGSIVDALLGVGAKNSVLGFAGSAYSSSCLYVEGRGVISGFLNVSDTTMGVVIAHEVGHLIGMDHTQLDNAQGLTTSNYPLMYPIAYRTGLSLHEDDAAAASALYPDTNLDSAYGRATGALTLGDGTTPVLGANIWTQETTTRRVYSIVSDYLTQNTGFFSLLLPPGTYQLHAEAIRSAFDGGSGVGPYSETYPTSPSFQPPLYSGSTPMAPVTLGNSTPVQFVITAGCAASVSFRLNGTGSVGGNCGTRSTPTIALTSSANPATVSTAVTFSATLTSSGVAPTGTVDFRDGGTSLGGCSAVTLASGVARCTSTSLTAGTHSITAIYSGDSAYNTVTSSALSQVVQSTPPPAGTNVAAASAGAVATASSTFGPGFPASAVNNGDRTGAGWGNGGGWNDATAGVYPDWVQINFNGSKTIDRVVVYTLQDNYASPVEPSDTLTFSGFGVTAFTVQGWDGANWVRLGSVTSNNLVKRTVTFTAYTTDRMRIQIDNALAGHSRITEIEAFGTSASAAPTGTNVAAASAGAVAIASSTIGAGFSASGVNNGDRTGAGWGNGGGWNDATPNSYPDWVQINFNGSKTIDRVVVYTLQDNFMGPVEPSDTMTFSAYGVTAFTVQGWDGANWVALGSVTGNNLVKRTVTFTAYTTDRIRVQIDNALAGYSRITEIEAFGTSGSTTPTSTNVAAAGAGAVASVSSSAGAGFPASALNNGDRTGAGWGSGGGWNDATPGAFPDFVQITFNGSKTIDRVVVYTLQDNFTNPVEPSDTLTFSAYGVTAFSVQGWDGANWVTLGSVANNNLVKRTVTFTAYTTDRIRIQIDNALAGYSRLTEVEAFGSSSTSSSGTNVGAASSGAVASASSAYGAGYSAAAVNNGDRTGAGWGSGGGWNDASAGSYPDWVQLTFNGMKTIDRVVVYTLQDNYANPVEPSDTMTFGSYGVTAFTVQGWNGESWATLATVTGNNLVKRTVTFAAYTTGRIRVQVDAALAGYSRITEIEAFGS